MNISLFWSSNLRKDSETFNHWRHRRISLSTFHEATLLSHVKAGNTVRLYTYQNFDESVPIPSEIIVEDADRYFSAEDAFSALKRGHSIAHISDVVRLMSAIRYESVVMDIDNIALRPFPEIDTFTSTMAAKTTGAMAIQFKDNHPPFRIKDGSWDGKALSVFPTKVHKTISEDIKELCGKIESSLSKLPTKGTKGWNYVVWTLKEIANKYEHVHVMKPIDTTPFPAWKSAGKCYSLDAPTKLDGVTRRCLQLPICYSLNRQLDDSDVRCVYQNHEILRRLLHLRLGLPSGIPLAYRAIPLPAKLSRQVYSN